MDDDGKLQPCERDRRDDFREFWSLDERRVPGIGQVASETTGGACPLWMARRNPGRGLDMIKAKARFVHVGRAGAMPSDSANLVVSWPILRRVWKTRAGQSPRTLPSRTAR